MTYGETFVEQVRRSKEARALAAGRSLCGRCRGSGMVNASRELGARLPALLRPRLPDRAGDLDGELV